MESLFAGICSRSATPPILFSETRMPLAVESLHCRAPDGAYAKTKLTNAPFIREKYHPAPSFSRQYRPSDLANRQRPDFSGTTGSIDFRLCFALEMFPSDISYLYEITF
jgi:hypothetical protein